MKFDRDILYRELRNWQGPLNDQQVNGINFVLDSLELDSYVTRVEWPAYMFATMKLETANTYQPIHEFGGHDYFVKRYGGQTALGHRLGNITPEDGATFAGEGDVQETGRANAIKSTVALKEQYPELVAAFEARTGKTFDLVANSGERGDPAIAYAIMSYGMRTGMFTGKKLSDYTKVAGFDSINARRIINGLDHADIIAGYYKHWLAILQAALVEG